MNIERQQKLAALYETYKAFDDSQEDRLNRWRNIEPESAQFLAMTLRAMQAKSVLEIGTSNGFSTLWLADALQSTGGKMDSVELEAERSALAAQSLQDFGLAGEVTLHTADAGVFLAQCDGEYDFILLDAERKYYPQYWQDLKKIMARRPHALLVVDNVLSHADQVVDFVALIDQEGEAFMQTTLPIGAGLLLVTQA